MKNGSQQMRKAPTMMPKVVAALDSRSRCFSTEVRMAVSEVVDTRFILRTSEGFRPFRVVEAVLGTKLWCGVKLASLSP